MIKKFSFQWRVCKFAISAVVYSTQQFSSTLKIFSAKIGAHRSKQSLQILRYCPFNQVWLFTFTFGTGGAPSPLRSLHMGQGALVVGMQEIGSIMISCDMWHQDKLYRNCDIMVSYIVTVTSWLKLILTSSLWWAFHNCEIMNSFHVTVLFWLVPVTSWSDLL